MRSSVVLLLVSVLNADDAANFKAAAEYSKANGGQCLLVYKSGKLVFEDYYNGFKPDTAHFLASGTKSFAGIAAACAVEDGLLKWDEPVSDTITEWKSDARKAKITVRHLLSLTSGLDAGSNGSVPAYEEAIKAEAKHEAGKKFEYGPVPYQCFGELMKRKLKAKNEDYLKYLHRRVFDPIGMSVKFWTKDRHGDPHLPSGAFLTPKEWAKFGLLLHNHGKWNNEHIVRNEILEEILKPGPVTQRYGLTYWLAGTEAKLPKADAEKFFMAAGAGNQRLYVLREADLVVVQFAALKSKTDDQELLKKLTGK